MKRFLRRIVWFGVITGIVMILGLFLSLDNFWRDLTQNRAQTSADAQDPQFRPIETNLSPEKAASLVESAGALPRWRLESVETDEQTESIVMHFVRTTRLFRFQDDIRITLTAQENGTRITAVSQSRVGKGDLGQNPRNLTEILGAIREKLSQ